MKSVYLVTNIRPVRAKYLLTKRGHYTLVQDIGMKYRERVKTVGHIPLLQDTCESRIGSVYKVKNRTFRFAFRLEASLTERHRDEWFIHCSNRFAVWRNWLC